MFPGTPDIELLKKLTIHCSPIGTERENKDVNCSTNRCHTHDAGGEQHYANMGQKESCKRTNSNVYCYTNTGKISNLINSNTFTLMVKYNDFEYFLPGLSQESDRKASAKITKQLHQAFEDVLMV